MTAPLTVRKKYHIQSAIISAQDLGDIYRLISEYWGKMLDDEVANLTLGGSLSGDEGNALADAYNRSRNVAIQVLSEDGQEILASTESALGESKLPKEVSRIVMDSGYNYRQIFGRAPEKGIFVVLDFSKPKMTGSNPALQPTVNQSVVEVWGGSDHIMAPAYQAFSEYFSSKIAYRRWLHYRFLYDILLVFIGAPMGFWFLYRLSPVVESIDMHIVAASMAHIYLFFSWLWVFRFLFGMAQWAWSPVELHLGRLSPDRIIRAFWKGLSLTVLGALVYDIVSVIFVA